MAGSMRAESALNSLDGSTFAGAYQNGQRGAYSGANLERSGSFRESLENRPMVSGLGTSRNAAQTLEIPTVSRYLPLEPIALSEQKYTRSNELRRVLGVSLEEQHSFGSVQSKPLPPIASEELKRFKASLQETSSRARDRAKLFNDSMLKLDKYRNILSKKRQRSEILSSEKSGSSTLLKIGGQIHQNPSDLVSQRLEERTKNVVPNKRARSSMPESEGRGSVPMRHGTIIDKDKPFDTNRNVLRASSVGSMSSEDKVRGLFAGGDGWEKKQKRKRSVGTMVRTPDGERELKQAIQQKPNNEPRVRSCDGLGSRPGASNGFAGNNKMDPGSQLSGASSRVIPRNEFDNGPIPIDRRERSALLEKERTIAKGSNKINIREDAHVGSQSPSTKGKGSRTPRTGSGVLMNTPNFPRSSGGIDGWEQSSSFQKFLPLTGGTNRKRNLPTGSSSPPVAQWVGQRPQTISRTRRANVVSPVSNLDEAQILPEGYAAPDVGARVTTAESSGLLLSRGIPTNTHQYKLKLENVPSPVGISESEESGATENKSNDKVIDNGEVENVALNVVHKAPTFVLPPKKNKVSPKEEIGDVVRRQGRSGRGSIQSKACLPVVKEKLENIDTTKPLKSGRPCSDKSESRVGRPPSKKVSDRKTHIRSGQILNGGSSELTGELNDDREELLAAGNAARNASYLGCSSSFWKKMEPIFAFASSEDINYAKHQISFAEELDESLCNMVDADRNVMCKRACQTVASTHSSFPIEQVSQTRVAELPKYAGTACVVDEPRPVKTASGKLETEGWFDNIIPLSQRLLSAFIAEDGTENFDCSIEQGDTFLQFSSDYSSFGTHSHVENEQEPGHMKSRLELDLDFNNIKNCPLDNNPCNGYKASSKLRSPNTHTRMSCDELSEEDVLLPRDTGDLSEIGRTNLNQLRLMSTGVSDASPYECQLDHMSLDDRILMELHSIGLYPETVPDLADGEDEEIDKAILELKMRLYQQARKKKNQLFPLQKAILDRKEIEERNVEQLAMNKLVEMAYKKLTGGRASHGSSHKGGVNKVSKQLAMAFAKRTLARCRKFEETGRSCFSEPAFRDVVFSESLYSGDAKCFDGISNGTGINIYVETRGSQLGSLVSGITSASEMNGLGHKLDRGQLDSFNGLTQTSEQSFSKNDQISNRGKKRDVLLDDVVTSAASRATPAHSHNIPCGTNWKRTDRDREQNKDTLTRNSTAKAGRPSLGSGRGERKTRTKPKQKIVQLSTSGNGLGRVTETATFLLPSMQESCETVSSHSARANLEAEPPSSGSLTRDLSKEIEDNIFTNLPLHGIDSIDELDVADGLGGQGQDIGTWLSFDEEALQDHDLVGLEIPMDDLSELKLNF